MSLAWSRRMISELENADRRVERLARPLNRAQLNWNPTPGAWSIGHCLQHLLIGNEIYRPAIKASLEGRNIGRCRNWLSVGSAAGSSATTWRLHRLLLRRPKRSGPLELWNAQLL